MTHITQKNNKGDIDMSIVRKELAISAYERLIDEYLKLCDYNLSNGKFKASRPWLLIDTINKKFKINYSEFLSNDFNEYKRDVFLNYILKEDETVDEEKIDFLNARPNLLTRKLRDVESFMFIANKKEKVLSKGENLNVFFKNKYAPIITKGPVDEICSAVSKKDNFQKFQDIYDFVDENTQKKINDSIEMKNYGIDYDMKDINLSIDVVTEEDNVILNNDKELRSLQMILDEKLEEASKNLSHDTERVLRYLQSIRYYETKNKPVIEGYTAVMEIDVDDMIRAFDLRVCPENRAVILKQLNQISNLTLNIKIDKDMPEYEKYKNGRKRNKKDVLYISSKLINFSYAIQYTKNINENEKNRSINISSLDNININTISRAKVNIAWTDLFERLYSEGQEFLNLNLPAEVFQLPRYKVKNFDLCMYLARLSNSVLSNNKNKNKAVPTTSIRIIKFLEAINASSEIESARKKGEKLKSLLDIIEDSIELYVRNEVLKEKTITEFRENRSFITINNYKDFKITLYFDKTKKQIEATELD